MSAKNNYIFHKLAQLPLVSLYAKTRGWSYIIAWGHRLAGIVLVFYACFHVYTLSLLETPAHYDTKMQIFSSPLFVFFEWLLAVPVIFHALNGGRLILYESFGNREDNAVIKWLSSFSAVYPIFRHLDDCGKPECLCTVFLDRHAGGGPEPGISGDA